MRKILTVSAALCCLLLPIPGQAEDDQLGQLLDDRKRPPEAVPVPGVPSLPQVQTRPDPGAPQVRSRPSLLLPPVREALPEEAPAVEVDTTGLWFLIRRGDLAAARADLMRLRRQNPAWPPPVDLLTALSPPERGPAVASGSRPADPAARAEARGWQALAAGQPDQARRWFTQAGASLSAREGLGRALVALDDLAAVRGLVAATPVLAARLAEAALGRALDGIDAGDGLFLSRDRLALATELGRAEAWETAGWRWLGQGLPGPAAAAFARAGDGENARFGQVLAERAEGRADVAEDLACQGTTLSARLAAACADALADRQLAAYQAGDYAAVLALAERISQTAPDRRGPQELKAWSLLRLNRPAEAADLFDRLYAATPTPALARALAQSLTAAGRGAELRQRAAAGDRLLAGIVHAQGVATAWGRKQFDLAARHADALLSDQPQ